MSYVHLHVPLSRGAWWRSARPELRWHRRGSRAKSRRGLLCLRGKAPRPRRPFVWKREIDSEFWSRVAVINLCFGEWNMIWWFSVLFVWQILIESVWFCCYSGERKWNFDLRLSKLACDCVGRGRFIWAENWASRSTRLGKPSNVLV